MFVLCPDSNLISKSRGKRDKVCNLFGGTVLQVPRVSTGGAISRNQLLAVSSLCLSYTPVKSLSIVCTSTCGQLFLHIWCALCLVILKCFPISSNDAPFFRNLHTAEFRAFIRNDISTRVALCKGFVYGRLWVMTQLEQLLESVKDEHLTKTDLEKYRDSMTHLHSAMQLELAEVEKTEAIFFETVKEQNPDMSDVAIKRKWKASNKGQRSIELNRFIKTVVKEIDSLKSRLYSIY